MSYRSLAVLLLLTLLTACAKEVAFPVKLPSQRVIDAQYETIKHDLSPLKQYHFTILIPTGWRTLDVRAESEPQGTAPVEMGAFREPGQWEDGKTATQTEISVSVLNASGSTLTGDTLALWLQGILDRSVPDHAVLAQRTTMSGDLPVADVLIRYDEAPAMIARFWAVPSRDKKHVFVVTGSAPEEEYPHVAQFLYTALATFSEGL